MQVILNHQQIHQKITRLGHELLENCFEEKELFIAGIQGNGFLMAKMFEYCNFSKEDKVLVIGCLTGYSVAILSNLVGYVFAIENDKSIL